MKFLACLNCLESAQTRKRICTNPNHIKYKRPVTPRNCLRCTTTEREEKSPRQASVFRPEIKPSEKPQKVHTEPPNITPLGTLIYPRIGWEPPPCLPGYTRKSEDLENPDAWVLEPIEPLCKHLNLVLGERGRCGYQSVKPTCVYKGSIEIKLKTCLKCPDKVPRDVQSST